METKAIIKIRTGKVESIRRFHPWVFSGAIKAIEGDPQEGDLVRIETNHGVFLAMGHYGKGSIAARIISWEDRSPDAEFWKNRIQPAWNYRQSLGFPEAGNTNVFRLIHAEGDLCPGLIADYFDGIVVLEFHSAGMEQAADLIAAALLDVLGENLKTIVAGSKKGESNMQILYGEEPELPFTVLENGMKFQINWREGQKTGFFNDQRENRKKLMNFVKDKKVLNMFSYTGAFSVYAKAAGASSVISVDASSKAIELAKNNMIANGYSVEENPCIESDAMEYLKAMPANEYDVIILDPPAYAKRSDARHNAIQGYKRLNGEAISKLKSGGYLFTFSCSQVVERHHFNSAVMAGALGTGRKVRVVDQLSQAPCHAHSLFHPEGFYLKGLILYVED
jgi:23S rRNA (cytosine1962-C5)-methyltransferase